MIGIAALVIIAAVLLGPMLLNTTWDAIGNSFNPAIQVSWSNNPLNLKANPTDNAMFTVTFTNTTKENLDINYTATSVSSEILIFPPAGTLTNVAPGDKRIVSFSIRKNVNVSVFTGTYTIDIASNIGEVKTKLDVIAK